MKRSQQVIKNDNLDSIIQSTITLHAQERLDERVSEYNEMYGENLSVKKIENKIKSKLAIIHRNIHVDEKFKINCINYILQYVACDKFVDDGVFGRLVITFSIKKIKHYEEEDKRRKRKHYIRRENDDYVNKNKRRKEYKKH